MYNRAAGQADAWDTITYLKGIKKMTNSELPVANDQDLHRWNRRASQEAGLALESASYHLLAISERLERTRHGVEFSVHQKTTRLLHKLIDEMTLMEGEIHDDFRESDEAFRACFPVVA
jgi:hypothetical protein